jgi:hypothetical protein
MSNITKAVKNFEVSLSEFTTSLQNAKERLAKDKLPEACKCIHCLHNVEVLEGTTIPMLNGQIAAIRATILTLNDQIESEGL